MITNYSLFKFKIFLNEICCYTALYISPTELHSAEYEVFIHYYSQIVTSLSAVALSPYFVKEKIISTADQSLIFSTPVQTTAASLLLSKISSALKAGINESFYKFLDITEQYGSIDSKNVITAIRKKLKAENKGMDMVDFHISGHVYLAN